MSELLHVYVIFMVALIGLVSIINQMVKRHYDNSTSVENIETKVQALIQKAHQTCQETQELARKNGVPLSGDKVITIPTRRIS